MRAKASVSMSLSTRRRRPPPSSIITMLAFLRKRGAGGGSGDAGVGGTGNVPTTSTGTSCGTDAAEIWQSSLRQRKSWLTWMPAECAISETLARGSSVAATNRSFSSRDQRRRRSTDVITSI